MHNNSFSLQNNLLKPSQWLVLLQITFAAGFNILLWACVAAEVVLGSMLAEEEIGKRRSAADWVTPIILAVVIISASLLQWWSEQKAESMMEALSVGNGFSVRDRLKLFTMKLKTHSQKYSSKKTLSLQKNLVPSKKPKIMQTEEAISVVRCKDKSGMGYGPGNWPMRRGSTLKRRKKETWRLTLRTRRCFYWSTKMGCGRPR